MSAFISDPSRRSAYQLDAPLSPDPHKEAGVSFQITQSGNKPSHKAQASTSSAITRQLSGVTLVSRRSLQQARQSVVDLPIHESVLKQGLLDRPVDEVFNEIQQRLDSVKNLTTEIQLTLHKAQIVPRSGPPRHPLPPLPGQSEAEAAIANAKLRARIAAISKKVKYQPDPEIPPRSPLRPNYEVKELFTPRPRVIGFAINQTPALPPVPENSFEFSYQNTKPRFPMTKPVMSEEKPLFNGFFDKPPGKRARVQQRAKTAVQDIWHKIADKVQTSLHAPAKRHAETTEKQSLLARFRTSFQEKTTRTRPWKPG